MHIIKKIVNIRHRLAAIILTLTICAVFFSSSAPSPAIRNSGATDAIYDLDAAKAYCDSTALEDPEGIWIYPEDVVTVLISGRREISSSSLPVYEIRVVESSDVRLHPGDIIGTLSALPERKKFEASIFTERGPIGLLKPKTVLATLSDEGETMVFKREKARFSLRFTFNPSTLLPKLWRVMRMNASRGNSSSASPAPAVGMVKIYPSYDGNGSSRRRPRYL